MSIKDSSVLIDGTIAVTAGTATGMLSKGDTIERHNVVLDDGSAFKDQTELTFQVKAPKVSSSAPAGYTQARNIVTIVVPKTLANGLITKNTLRIELSNDSETTDSERDSLRNLASQILSDSDFDQYWDSQAVG
jgi:hypothetical protein